MKYSACVLIIKGDKILGVSRKHDCNDFGLPGGKVDALESIEDAAVRECLEETGYSVILNKASPFVSECGDYQVTTYMAHIDESKPRQYIDPKETGLVKWIDPMVLLDGYFKEYNGKMLLHFGLAKKFKLEYSTHSNEVAQRKIYSVIQKDATSAIKALIVALKGNVYVHNTDEMF